MEFAQKIRNSENSEQPTSKTNKFHGRFMGNIMKNIYALMKSRFIMYQFTCKCIFYGKHCCKSVASNLSDLCNIFVLFALNFITDKYYTKRHS